MVSYGLLLYFDVLSKVLTESFILKMMDYNYLIVNLSVLGHKEDVGEIRRKLVDKITC